MITRQIIFVDPSVEDYQSLIGDLKNAEVVVFHKNSSGIEQITQTLAGRRDLDAIHILSHGAPGILYLGNAQLSLDTLPGLAEQFRQWGESGGSRGDDLARSLMCQGLGLLKPEKDCRLLTGLLTSVREISALEA